jgi:hypothetical protein
MADASLLVGRGDDDHNMPVKVEEYSGALVTVSVQHHAVHDGVFYTTDHLDLALAGSGIMEVLLTVNTRDHIELGALGTGNLLLEVFENPTVTANGTALSFHNLNRFAGDNLSPGIEAYHTPTTTADGQRLMRALISGGAKGAGSANGPDEGTGLTGTWFLVRLTNLTNQEQIAQIGINVHDHGADNGHS